MQRFNNQIVLIIGASGGLGQAFARAFAKEGAKLLLTARRANRIAALAADIHALDTFSLDVADTEQIKALADSLADTYPDLSVVVNATGYDVRKPFSDHSADDIAMSLAINLQAAMFITQAFLPVLTKRGDGYIVHLGGFADGRLAFPFYAANFASRAGLRGFADAVNREITGSGVTVGYFSPGPADTEAERPFHELWQQMGQRIVSTEAVANALLKAVSQKRSVSIMGGWTTVFFGHLNAVWPRMADRLVMNAYRDKLAAFFKVPLLMTARPAAKSRSTLYIGLSLVLASFLLYGIGLFLIPFLPITTAAKAVGIPISFAIGEASFWLGAALAGKDVISRYGRCLNPCNWRWTQWFST